MAVKVDICENCGHQKMHRFYLDSVEDRLKYDFIIQNFDRFTLESLERAANEGEK